MICLVCSICKRVMLIAPEVQNMCRSLWRISLKSHEEKTVTPKLFVYHHMMTLFVEFFNIVVPFSASIESIF